MRLCEGCGKPLPAGSRPNGTHCSPACRVAAHRHRPRDERDQERREWLGLTATQAHALDSALAEERLLASVAHAARENWRAAAWLLERRHQHWSLRPREPEDAPPPDHNDPFREMDELAARRRRLR